MKQVKSIVVLIASASLLLFAACSPKEGDDLKKAQGFVDEMCKCEDEACFDAVEGKLKKAIDEKAAEKLEKEHAAEFAKLEERMESCRPGPIHKVAAFIDEMCACKDAACLEEVGKRAQEGMPGDVMQQLMKDEAAKMNELMKKLQECTAKLAVPPAGDHPDHPGHGDHAAPPPPPDDHAGHGHGTPPPPPEQAPPAPPTDTKAPAAPKAKTKVKAGGVDAG